MRGQMLMLIIASILIVIGISQQVYAVPTVLTEVIDDPTHCDTLVVPFSVEELGIGSGSGPFPPDEEISSVGTTIGSPSCLPVVDELENERNISIFNETPFTFSNLVYVADEETFISNWDGFINDGRAFHIDSVGVNAPLVFDAGFDGLFTPGETWTFVLQDYSNTSFHPGDLMASLGVGSFSTTGFSSGSVIAFEIVVGGTSIPIDTTSLLLAGASVNAWMIPVVMSAAGFGILIARKI